MSKKGMAAIVATLFLTIGFVPTAIAAPTVVVQGGPYTNLAPAGADIHFGFGNFPKDHGLYLYEAVKSADTSRPTIINQASQVWVSLAPNATSPLGDVKVHVTGVFTNADCAKVTCGIFVRLDHTAPADTSEDQFLPISFAAASAVVTSAPLPLDTITVKVDGMEVAPNVPGTLAYRAPITFEVKVGSGTTPTLKSYTPECALNGFTITALKGTGQCDIAVTAPGDAMTATKTSHYPFNLALGTQILAPTTTVAKAGKIISMAKFTNFGEKISYKSSTPKVCRASSNKIKVLKSGNCLLLASASARSGYYNSYSSKLVLVVTK
jgi:hypothetical protein